MAGNGWGEEAAGDERAWLAARRRTAADGVVARQWLEMGREKKTLEMSELGCADGCGVVGNGGEKKPLGMSELCCADGCGRRGCKGGGWKWVG